MEIRYIGLCYDVASYEAVAYLESPTTIKKVMDAASEAEMALLECKRGIFNTRLVVRTGDRSIEVVVAGEIHECKECGGQGHRPEGCPYKEER